MAAVLARLQVASAEANSRTINCAVLTAARRNPEGIAREAATDGVYVIRSNAPASQHSAADLVRRYKDLRHVEQLFRALEGVDVAARTIRHRKADRTSAHLFVWLLAFYVRWHLERAWATLTYRDHDPPGVPRHHRAQHRPAARERRHLHPRHHPHPPPTARPRPRGNHQPVEASAHPANTLNPVGDGAHACTGGPSPG